MSWRLHHVMLPSRYVRDSANFYSEIFAIEETTPNFKDMDRGVFATDQENVAWFDDGSCQLHVARPTGTFAVDNGFHIDPIINGHLAIEVDDIERVKSRLRARGVYFADAGNWALPGYTQIYCLDPAMNAVEVNQRISG